MPGPIPSIKIVKLGSRFKGVVKLDERESVKLPAFDKDEKVIELEQLVKVKEQVTDEETGETTEQELEKKVALELHTVEYWANTKGVLPVWFHAAKVTRKWPNLFEITEADFDAAVLATQNVRLG